MSKHDQCPSTRGKTAPPATRELSRVGGTGQQMWRSPEELADTPEFRDMVEREFPAGASELLDGSRRTFLKLMGAGLALAGAATIPGCRRPDHKILPYSRSIPEDIVVGKPLYFATSMPLPGGGAEGLMVETHEGRPTKVEGGFLHPVNRGKSTQWSQASILELYDPDRVKGAIFNPPGGEPVSATWPDFLNWWTGRAEGIENLQARYDDSRGRGLAFLVDRNSSPSRRAVRDRLRERWPEAIWAVHEPAQSDNPRRGTEIAFGSPHRELLDLSRADVIFSLNRDFLEACSVNEPMALRHARDFASRRGPKEAGDSMNRLYVVESAFTSTGGCADHRKAVAPSRVAAYAVALARTLLDGVGGEGWSRLRSALNDVSVPQGDDLDMAFVRAAADDLRTHTGRAVVLVGPEQPAEIHALAHAINASLRSIGSDRVVDFLPLDPDSDDCAPCDGAKAIADAIDAGRVETLICINTNPVYDAPADLNFADKYARVRRTITLSTQMTETGEASMWQLSRACYLEAWGDTMSADGTIAPVQPVIAPLFAPAYSEIELLGWFSGEEAYLPVENDGRSRSTPDPRRMADGHRIVMHTWRSLGLLGEVEGPGPRPVFDRDPQPDPENESAMAAWQEREDARQNRLAAWERENRRFERELDRPWRRARQNGVANMPSRRRPENAMARGRVDGVGDALAAVASRIGSVRVPEAPRPENLDVFFYTGPVGDGRFANTPWLQEQPHAATRVVWDNPVVVSPATAEALNLTPDPYTRRQPKARMARLTVGDRAVDVPVWIMPGMADGCVGVMLGYGRTAAGSVGDGVGFNTYRARSAGQGLMARGARLARSNARYFIASTQNHWSLEGRTTIFRQIDKPYFDKYAAKPIEAKPDEIYGVYEKRLNLAEQLGELDHTPPNIGAYANPFNQSRGDVRPDRTVRDRLGREVPPEFARRPQWGMTIDTSTCIGCGTCTVACRSENNIPVVGKTEVARGREMSWIRVDRYFTGDDWRTPDEMVHQPIACVQCENAPCEVVCPVNATVHGPEGLNLMVYNRCIGTRYCSNNCPYKVRRFNFFDWGQTKFNGRFAFQDRIGARPDNLNLIPPRLRERVDQVSRMRQNPDVTVRSRGVMEKCTYCLQRINRARFEMKLKHLENIPDGFFQTACQQACPTSAIVFGDILDETSEVSKLRASHRSYLLLGYLNTRPRTSHLLRVRNPNPRLREPKDPKAYASATGNEGGEGVGGVRQGLLHDPKRRHEDAGYVGSLSVLGVHA